ncbi:MAG: hypothetical protein EOM06_05040 [Sphingobacteriia bacterium]|nr:hypothetical protein [Sphingobacteriia bacterium]
MMKKNKSAASVLLKIVSRLMLFSLCIHAVFFAHGQESVSTKSLPLFSSHEILEFTIKADFKTILNDIGEDHSEHPAVIEYIDFQDTVRLDCKIRTRGNFRRDRKNCSFPPLRLNFKKKQTLGTLFEDIDKIKLVTHCRSNQKKYQRYLVREYLVYRALNIITDTSYQTRLVHIKYEDIHPDSKSVESFGILIEPDEVFENRFTATESDQKYLFPDSTNYVHMGKITFFQYMIGNTDWAVTTLHNIRLFTIQPEEPPYSIPYDFDWCGLVNTHYAAPLPRFGTTSVTERVYRGQCRPWEQLKQTVAYFNSKQSELFSLFENYPYLSKGEKRVIKRYLDDFYKTINNDRLLKIRIFDQCLK